MTGRHVLRLFVLALAVLAFLQIGCSRRPTTQVLFVGNSLTYVNNLPAALSALAAANGRSLQADMIVKGGATLTEHFGDGSVARALAQRHYDFVVLQERGGDFLCGFVPSKCRDAKGSTMALVRIARNAKAVPLLLGTYQTMPEVSAVLVNEESQAARTVTVPYVAVSDRLQRGLTTSPKKSWLYADDMHPGPDLVLLESVLLYRQLFGALPATQAFSVHAPMYRPDAKFSTPAPISLPMLKGNE
ncbi:hypothetical protein GCM10008098_10850 [Rhodanobacter panaciterrae]|uniref:SGNH/GDSL hydrolase family protein n=1 Tax=Rhodanobacter panaciterrae TaxID=490572 RepID=A0ABQ2ZMB7_9GAMM|nr:hypothetical protein GCM10008098_10850 [Rhodanobacter panaciterrae]